jgi:deoxyadenosine/deoxycytidine kinase
MDFVRQCNISLQMASRQILTDYYNRFIDSGFQLGKSQTLQTVPDDYLFPKLSIPELRKQIMQRGQNTEERTFKRSRSD